jgi:hypothetical protein
MVDNEGQAATDPLSVDQSEAYNILNDLESQGKITSEKAELYKQKFYQLHKACLQNMENERHLAQKIS